MATSTSFSAQQRACKPIDLPAANFTVVHHSVPGQHIRELPNTLLVDDGSADSTLYLSVKQYIPLNNPSPQPGDVTLIALHANGYNKEIYEPLWDDLITTLSTTNDTSKSTTTRIRSIFMIDAVHHGHSATINENTLAHDSPISWDDHARDVLCVINGLREHMTAPLLGVGHSMGGSQLIALTKLHPRLFHAIVLMDPWLTGMCATSGPETYHKRSKARDRLFRDRDAVRKAYSKVPLFQPWDKRCFERFMDTAWKELAIEDDNGEPQTVTVPTTSASVTFHVGKRVYNNPVTLDRDKASREDRLVYPDLLFDSPSPWPFCMLQAGHTLKQLPHIRPRTLYLYGDKGSAIPAKYHQQIRETTGTQCGGSGGQRLGCVSDGKVKGSHFFPFESPKATAERLASWCREEQAVWRSEKEMLDKRFGQGRSVKERQQFPLQFDIVRKNWGWVSREMEAAGRSKL